MSLLVDELTDIHCVYSMTIDLPSVGEYHEWYICSAVSASASLIHSKCISITNHWYINTDTSTARNHIKKFYCPPLHCRFQSFVRSRLQNLVISMGLRCCSNVFRTLTRIFANNLGFHNTLCAQTFILCSWEVSAKYRVLMMLCICISIMILSCKGITYQDTFS